LHGLGQINLRRGRLDPALALFQEAPKCDISRADGFAISGSSSIRFGITSGRWSVLTRVSSSRTMLSSSTGAV
jgi:hypothetical protein